jgi:hypothetical protein
MGILGCLNKTDEADQHFRGILTVLAKMSRKNLLNFGFTDLASFAFSVCARSAQTLNGVAAVGSAAEICFLRRVQDLS